MSERWTVECDDGVRDVFVTRPTDGRWNAATVVNGLVVQRNDAKNARAAVTHLASALAWGVVKNLAPSAVSADGDHKRGRPW